MIKDKISSQEIIDLVSSKASVSKRAAEEFLKVMIASIEEALMAGEVVKIKNFGTFKLQWNEPRKSVNVHTGEDIIIPGYSKITFVPDVVLKNVVNEPFAHLQPVVLDGDNNETDEVPVDEVALDPLRVLNEQAADIKGLLADIQALSPKKKQILVEEEVVLIDKVTPEPKRIEIQDYDLTLLDAVETSKAENHVEEPVLKPENEEVFVSQEVTELKSEVSPEIDTKIEHVTAALEKDDIISSYGIPKYDDDDEIESEPTASEDYVPSSFLDHQISLKKKRKWLIPVASLLLLLIVLFGLYFLFPPVTGYIDRSWSSLRSASTDAKQNFSMTEMFNTVSKWAEPKKSEPEVVVVPKPKQMIDSIVDDSISTMIQNPTINPVVKSTTQPLIKTVPVKKTIDSLQIMLNGPRVYKKFIGSERISSGSRLTLMAKKYYKKSDFWVYIYEANKASIPNPDNIAAGTLIQIPKLDARLIDASNPKCIKKALELHDLYVKKRQ